MSSKSIIARYLDEAGWKYRMLARQLAKLPCDHRPKCEGGCLLYAVHYSTLYKVLSYDTHNAGPALALKLERGTQLLKELGVTDAKPMKAERLCKRAAA